MSTTRPLTGERARGTVHQPGSDRRHQERPAHAGDHNGRLPRQRTLSLFRYGEAHGLGYATFVGATHRRMGISVVQSQPHREGLRRPRSLPVLSHLAGGPELYLYGGSTRRAEKHHVTRKDSNFLPSGTDYSKPSNMYFRLRSRCGFSIDIAACGRGWRTGEDETGHRHVIAEPFCKFQSPFARICCGSVTAAEWRALQ